MPQKRGPRDIRTGLGKFMRRAKNLATMDVKDAGKAIRKYGDRDVKDVGKDIKNVAKGTKEAVHGAKRFFKKRRKAHDAKLRREDYVRKQVGKRFGKKTLEAMPTSNRYHDSSIRPFGIRKRSRLERSYDRVNEAKRKGKEKRDQARRLVKHLDSSKGQSMPRRRANPVRGAALPPPPPRRRS